MAPNEILGSSVVPGTLTIQGDYRQGAGGLFQAHIMEAGTNSQLAIVGMAELGGNIEVVIAGSPFAIGDQVRLITTNQPIKGMFDTASISGDPIGDDKTVPLFGIA